jgi:hypothetical protein
VSRLIRKAILGVADVSPLAHTRCKDLGQIP